MPHIKRGLEIPISGSLKETVQLPNDAINSPLVAVTGLDYQGMKPSMKVKVGDTVKMGEELFHCKKVQGVIYTAPAAGKIVAINRGAKRLFLNVVIEVDPQAEQVKFLHFTGKAVSDLKSDEVRSLLVESGLWTAFRTRPYSKTPAIDSQSNSIFVTAMDTNPLSFDPSVVINHYSNEFSQGMLALSHLTEGKVYLCQRPEAKLPDAGSSVIEVKRFTGVHPAGNVGTHIHFVDPVHAHKSVWHIGYQEVIAIGKLFSEGKLWNERFVSLAGPGVNNPQLIKTQVGANIFALIKGQLKDGVLRVISGSILNGRKVEGHLNFLGRFHNQISVLSEGDEREFLGWHSPGVDKFSIKRTFLSALMPGKVFDLKTGINGSHRAMVPVGLFEKVMPLDILPTQLLRALVTKDTDLAQNLGCLELDEEDLALCTFASPGKTDFGLYLRENLTTIEKEG